MLTTQPASRPEQPELHQPSRRQLRFTIHIASAPKHIDAAQIPYLRRRHPHRHPYRISQGVQPRAADIGGTVAQIQGRAEWRGE
jgi:hypothetical protein